MAVVKRKLPDGTKKKRSVAPGVMMETEKLSLPTSRSEPSTNILDFTTLLFGEKKIGKTDLTAQYPDTLHLMTEPGGKAQSIFQRAVSDWRTYLGYVRLLKKDKRFRHVSIDVIDILYERCMEHVCSEMGIDHPSDEGYGKGWNAVRKEFTKGILALLDTGKGVTFVSHAAEKEIKMRGGETYDRISPTMAGQARDIVEGLVDLWFYYGYEGRRRTLTIQGSDHIGAGHRLKNNFLHPTTGAPITEIDMGSSAEEGYANLIAAFRNQYTPSKKDDDAPKTTKVVKKKLAIKR